MRYTLYLRTGSRPDHTDFFLQKAGTVEDLQKSHQTIQRWIAQMNLKVTNAQAALLVIADGNTAILEARYVSGTRRQWRDIFAGTVEAIVKAHNPGSVPDLASVKTQDSVRALNSVP